jgi:hypothetical protein
LAVTLVGMVGLGAAQTRPAPDTALHLLCRDTDGDGRCSPFELVRSADRVLGPRAGRLLSARRRLGDRPQYAAVVRGLDDAGP